MQFQRLEFKNARGERLAGRLDLPAGVRPGTYAIFAHCFTCTKNFNAILNINRSLVKEGIAVLRFDFTGIGESEGDFSGTSFGTNVDDLVAAADFLSSAYEPPKLLVGHSLGGAAVLQAARRIPSCTAVATIGAPADLSNLHRILRPSRITGAGSGQAEVTLYGKTFRLGEQFVEELGDDRMESAIGHLGRALMIFHSPSDEVVAVENAWRIFGAAEYPKSFVSLEGADHLLTRREDSLYVGSVLASWSARYLGLTPERQVSGGLQDNRIVAKTGRKGYQTEILAGRHKLVADEPIPLGGADTGPNPYDLLVGALGACTSMTLRMYADRKNWPLEGITVRLRHKKIYAEDCEQCETKSGKVDAIDREIELEGDLDEDQRQRLLGIADRCPVHRTLRSEVQVTTHLKEEDSTAQAGLEETPTGGGQPPVA